MELKEAFEGFKANPSVLIRHKGKLEQNNGEFFEYVVAIPNEHLRKLLQAVAVFKPSGLITENGDNVGCGVYPFQRYLIKRALAGIIPRQHYILFEKGLLENGTATFKVSYEGLNTIRNTIRSIFPTIQKAIEVARDDDLTIESKGEFVFQDNRQ